MEELDLKELLMLFWNKKVKILLIVAIFMAIGIIYTIGFVTPVYTSSTSLVLATSNSSQQSSGTITTTDLTLNSNLVSTYRELVTSTSVVRQVISNLGITMEEEQLKKEISVSSVTNTALIKISVTDENSINAAKIANELANVFAEEVTKIYKLDNVYVLDKAEVSETPSNVNHTKDVIIFTCAGLVVAVLYVIILNMLDTTIKSAEEVEKQFKVPVLASIPLYNFEPVKKGGKKR